MGSGRCKEVDDRGRVGARGVNQAPCHVQRRPFVPLSRGYYEHGPADYRAFKAVHISLLRSPYRTTDPTQVRVACRSIAWSCS